MPEYKIYVKGPSPEAVNIDFSAPHSMGNLTNYLRAKFTNTGLKVLANPLVEVLIFPGNQEQLGHWLAQNGIVSGLRITRNRSFITLGIHLVRFPNGKFKAIIDEVYGQDRMLHTQAMVAGILALNGREKSDFGILIEEASHFPTPVEKIFANEMEKIKPGTIDAAIIGFHWKIVNELEQRHALYKMSGSLTAVSKGDIARKWRQRLKLLGVEIEKKSWPRRHFDNLNIPFSYLAFKNKAGKPLNILLTRNVYGDQLRALLDVLISKKGINKIVLFGNAGGLAPDAKIGDRYLPTEVRKYDTGWVRINNSLSKDKRVNKAFKQCRLYSVFSPIVETTSFIDALKKGNVDVVDVENAYLACPANRSGINIGSIIVVSDIPGTSETLAHLEENEALMDESLTLSIDTILQHLDLVAPGEHLFPLH